MFDESLLAALDDTVEVRENGRSAVLCQLAREFLLRKRENEIDAAYERAYRGIEDPLGEGFRGWELECALEIRSGKPRPDCQRFQARGRSRREAAAPLR